jgi:hypothetical protein
MVSWTRVESPAELTSTPLDPAGALRFADLSSFLTLMTGAWAASIAAVRLAR